jgi:AcrR family transcriptional regulator
MGRPPNVDGRQTRAAILDAALTLFAGKGYFGTSLRDIARAVGVRESALYNYFPGKEALFTALITAAHEQRAEKLAALLEQSNAGPRQTLERLTAMLLDDFATPRQQQLFLVLMSDGMRLAREGRINLIDRITSGAAPLHSLMRSLVLRGHLRRQTPELLALEFLGPLLMWRHRHALQPEGPLIVKRKDFIREHVAHFLDGAAVAAARPVGRVRSGAPRRPGRTRTAARP